MTLIFFDTVVSSFVNFMDVQEAEIFLNLVDQMALFLFLKFNVLKIVEELLMYVVYKY